MLFILPIALFGSEPKARTQAVGRETSKTRYATVKQV
jgi:hypothetical protein